MNQCLVLYQALDRSSCVTNANHWLSQYDSVSILQRFSIITVPSIDCGSISLTTRRAHTKAGRLPWPPLKATGPSNIRAATTCDSRSQQKAKSIETYKLSTAFNIEKPCPDLTPQGHTQGQVPETTFIKIVTGGKTNKQWNLCELWTKRWLKEPEQTCLCCRFQREI